MIQLGRSYTRVDGTRIHARAAGGGIGYADGVEADMLRSVLSVTDRSTFSAEFIDRMIDWPSEYHFSRKRHLIVRPLGIKPGDRVLELGCGCGAITRYLGEIGAEVVAVEGEMSRIRVAAARCEDLPNVTFVVDNLLDVDIDERFDWVLMIGVLEYAQKFGRTADRPAEYLAVARSHLKAAGTLAIAIENKLGLKYLNGAAEDHNSVVNYGVEELYTGSDVTTWGRAELQEKLVRSGFASPQFYGVFPDYKLPRLIFSQGAAEEGRLRFEEMLLHSNSLDYSGRNTRFFDEALVMGAARKNRLALDLANSFLITARRDADTAPMGGDLLASYYAVERQAAFCTETLFRQVGAELRIEKRALTTASAAGAPDIVVVNEEGRQWRFRHVLSNEDEPYYEGQLLELAFTRAVKRRDVAAIREIFALWMVYLRQRFSLHVQTPHGPRPIAVTDSTAGMAPSLLLIDGAAFDCGPQNMVLDGDTINSFDHEWRCDEPVPLVWVLTRICAHINRKAYGLPESVNVGSLVKLAFGLLSVRIDDDAINEAAVLEKQFQAAVTQPEPSSRRPIRVDVSWAVPVH